MQKVLFLFLCTLFSVFSIAQNTVGKKFRFGLGPSYSIPVSGLKETYSRAYGINFIGKYNITNSLSIFVEAGGQMFYNKSDYNNELNFPFIGGGRFTYHGFFTAAGVGHSMSIWADNLDGFIYDLQLGYGLGSFNVLCHYTSSTAYSSPLTYYGFKVYYLF